MTEVLKERCSSLPLIETCPASTVIVPGEVRVESSNRQADVGSAVHWLLQGSVGRRAPNDALFDEAATKFGISTEHRDEMAWMFWWGWTAWKKISQYFPSPKTETELTFQDPRGIDLTGHLDVHDLVDTDVRIVDWKSGRIDGDHESQLRGYGVLGLVHYPQARTVSAATVRIRDRVAEWRKWRREELEAWWNSVVRLLQSESKSYNPGPHCAFCPRGAACEAKTALIRQACEALVGEPYLELSGDPTQRGRQLGAIYDQVSLLEKISKQARAVIKSAVLEAGGCVPIGAGRQLVISEFTTTEIVATTKSLNSVANLVGVDHLPEVVSISNPELKRLVMAGVGKGQKKAAWELVLAGLRELGVVRQHTTNRLEMKRGAIEEQVDHSTVNSLELSGGETK